MSDAIIAFIIILSISFGEITAGQSLEKVNISSTSYNELHRILVINQIQNHIPVQDSIHTRPNLNLDGVYDFCFDDQGQGFDQKWHESDLKYKCQHDNFYRMSVPSAFNDILSNKTAKNYIGWFWYQTQLSNLKFFKESQLWQWFIQFENVNYMTIVYLQDVTSKTNPPSHLIGTHVGGHLPFRLNLTQFVASLGSDAETTNLRLTIAVNNNLTSETIPSGKLVDLSEQVGFKFTKFQPDFDFFHFAGIIGSINLIKLHPVHITQVNLVYLNPNNFDAPVYNVCISSLYWKGQKMEAQLEAHSLLPHTERFELDDAKRIPENNQCALLRARDSEWTLSQGRPNHFSNLSTVKIKLKLLMKRSAPAANFFMSLFQEYDRSSSDKEALQVIDVQEVDETELKRGVPSGWRLDLKQGLLVDGERQQLQGFGMHQEQFISGRSMSQSAILKDMYLLKQLGANVLRTSHYPYSVEYLNACDENGLLVIAECPAVGLNSFSSMKLDLHKQMLLEMMQRDHHHPSIIMWSVANEPQSQLPEAKAYFESLLQYARNDLALYTTKANRPLTAAIAQSHKDDQVAHTLDVIMVNKYFGWYSYTGIIEAIRLPLISSIYGWASKHPGKPLLISEFGADSVAGLHSSTRDSLFSEEYQADLVVEHEHIFDELYEKNNSARHNLTFWGSMLWNFADFSTHNSLMRVGGNRKGILTRDRSPKVVFDKLKDLYQRRLKV